MVPPKSRGGRLVLAALLPLFVGCALQSTPNETRRVDPKLRPSTYIEEGNLVALVVGTRAARSRLDKAYLPFEIAVVNKGLAGLSLTPESFILLTADGQRYAAVGRDELTRGYRGSTDLDRRLAEAEPAIASRFASYTLVPSNLTPGFDQPIALDRLLVPRFGFILDFVYFPRPDEANLHAPLEMFVQAPELKDPVFVRFEISRPK